MNKLDKLKNENTKKIGKLIIDKAKLKDALEYLLDMYIQLVDNACQCENMYFDDPTELCPYCNAKEVLKEIKWYWKCNFNNVERSK